MGCDGRPSRRAPVHDVEVAAFAPRAARRSPAPSTRRSSPPRAAEAPPWWYASRVRRPRSAGGRRDLVRRRRRTRSGSLASSAARGGCPRRRSGSARRAAASTGAPTAWGDRCRAGEVPDGPPRRTVAGRGAATPNGYGLLDMGTDRPRVVPRLVRARPTTRSRPCAIRAVRRRASGAPAAADRGATTCAGRPRPRAAACPRRSATPTTASACCGRTRMSAERRRARARAPCRRPAGPSPSSARASSTSSPYGMMIESPVAMTRGRRAAVPALRRGPEDRRLRARGLLHLARRRAPSTASAWSSSTCPPTCGIRSGTSWSGSRRRRPPPKA